MIYFYVKERTTLNNGQYVELWMRRDGHDKDVFVDGYLKDYFSQYEIDLTFDQEMASLYSTGGVYYSITNSESIKEFTDRVRKNDYHLKSANLTYGDRFGYYGFYDFIGEVVETHESFWYRIYDIFSLEITRAKIGLLLKENSQ